MQILAERFLARHPSPFAAYMALQRSLCAHHVASGRGSAADFVERHGARFRARYAAAFGL